MLITLAGIQFTHILDFMIMMPLGPQFTQLFAISDAKFGLLVSAYTLAAGTSGLLAATYLDRFDRKKLLLVLYGLFGLATLGCGLATSYGSLMFARVMTGLFGGVLSALSQTIVADVIPFERRGRAMSVVMTSFSVATVAGIPAGLLLAAHFSWHAPFFGLVMLVALFAVAAWTTLPALSGHLRAGAKDGPFKSIGQVLADPNHLRAFGFSALLMVGGFTVIPFITIYLQTNVGWRPDQVSYVYLCGGVATLLTARYVGIATDKLGKVRVYRTMALLVMIPTVLTTMTQGFPMWAVLLVSTSLFLGMNSRMIPGMAIVSSTADPRLRGTFMALNSAVQSAAMGVAAFVGGALISRDANNLVQGYWKSSLVAVLAGFIAIALVGHLRMHQNPSPKA